MDMSEQDKNRNEEQIHYNSAHLSSNWQDGYAPTIWDHNATNSQTLGGYCDTNQQNSSSSHGFRKSDLLVSPKNPDMNWATPHSTMKMGDSYLSQFPSDSGFIERAARFSCFGGGGFGDMINPFANTTESSLSPYCNKAMPLFQGKSQEGSVGNGLKSVADEGSKATFLCVDFGDHSESQLKNEGQSESFVRSLDEAKRDCAGFSRNDEPDEAEYSEGAGPVGQGETSNEELGSKKRRRIGQDFDFDQVKGSTQALSEATKVSGGHQQQGGDNPLSISNKRSGKHGSEASKEEYVHVRARRGQATNSHSLAERVRREKISERMKFLQDLVPGCSKVTGKAVMLDEIINYVQSLQKQVEFLSMKLATVNPRMDFNIEGLLAKDSLQSRAGSSGTLGFGPDMTMPYPSQTGIIMPLDVVRRTVNSHLTAFNSSQVPNMWDDDLHNIMLIGLNPSSSSIGNQDLGSTPPKAEL